MYFVNMLRHPKRKVIRLGHSTNFVLLGLLMAGKKIQEKNIYSIKYYWGIENKKAQNN